jgi:hypothetical protein
LIKGGGLSLEAGRGGGGGGGCEWESRIVNVVTDVEGRLQSLK